MRTLPGRAWIGALILILLPSSGESQVIHLPPVYRPALSKDANILTLIPKGNATDLSKVFVAVQDDRLLITTPSKGLDIIPLRGREIHEIVAEIKQRYADLDAQSDYMLYSSRFLGPIGTTSLANPVTIKPNPNDPVVGLGFGIIFALASDDRPDGAGLLSEAGFQLDVIGTHQFVRPGSTGNGWKPDWINLQVRLGVNANQQLNVRTTNEVNQVPPVESQFPTALEQADQIAMTGQVDFTFPLVADQMDLVLTPTYGLSWTQLEPFVFPPIPVGSTAITADSAFTPVFLELARRELEQTLPLSEFGGIGIVQFRRNGLPLFYAGGGIVFKEIVQRQVQFTQPDSTAPPDRNSVRGQILPDLDVYWRAMFGARVVGAVDLKVDAAGPIGLRKGEPLLRLVIGHAFPIIRQ